MLVTVLCVVKRNNDRVCKEVKNNYIEATKTSNKCKRRVPKNTPKT